MRLDILLAVCAAVCVLCVSPVSASNPLCQYHTCWIELGNVTISNNSASFAAGLGDLSLKENIVHVTVHQPPAWSIMLRPWSTKTNFTEGVQGFAYACDSDKILTVYSNGSPILQLIPTDMVQACLTLNQFAQRIHTG